jgi:hypothetical protein
VKRQHHFVIFIRHFIAWISVLALLCEFSRLLGLSWEGVVAGAALWATMAPKVKER